VLIQLIMVGLVIAFPQMVMVYKDEAKLIDPAKLDYNLGPAATEADQQKTEDAGNTDLMKSLGGATPAKPDAPKAEEPVDDIMKALGGAPSGKEAPKENVKDVNKAEPKTDAKPSDAKAPTVKTKTPDEKAAEDIEKALKGIK
jgi:hypothetical protein